jgi:hypothetical protein
MIGVIGGNHVTLKRLMVEVGFANANSYNPNVTMVFNASFPEGTMLERVSHRTRSLPMINKKLVTNKLTALQKMQAAGMGDNIPEFSYDRQYEGNWIEKPFASQAGRGVQRYVSGAPVPHGKYLQRDVNKFREFRAHVGLWLRDPVFTIQEKKPKEELWERVYEGTTNYHWPIENVERRMKLPVTWNIESGFYFKRLTDYGNRVEKRERFPLIKRIEDVGVNAIKALGYQYGAVDILMNDNRELFVVEVNSHPAIKNEVSKEQYRYALGVLKTINTRLFNVLVTGRVPSTSTVTFRRPVS